MTQTTLRQLEVVLHRLFPPPTPTPSLFSPQNLIAQSQSGTGKTAAFVLAMLSHVNPDNKYPQVIIIILSLISAV